MIPRKHIEKGHLTQFYILPTELKIWTNDTHNRKKHFTDNNIFQTLLGNISK